MKKIILLYVAALLLVSCKTNLSRKEKKDGQLIKIPKAALEDKIKGGWAGKVIGVCYGAPTEFNFQSTFIPDYYHYKFDTAVIRKYFNNDDIYMNLTWVNVIEKYGFDAPADSFAKAFAYAGYELWHANLAGRLNVLYGKMPPASGYWLNNPHADDIDFQIEADFAGLMNPCMINSSALMCDKVGHIMNYGDGWYGGVFVASMLTQAFYSNDIEFIINEALKEIPSNSTFYKCISDVIKWHKEYPNDWKEIWFHLQRKWGEDIGCPDGVFTPINIDSKMNSAEVVIGLLYGGGDFEKSIDIAMRCGDDSDCNPATTGGIMGAMLGYSKIPEKFMEPLHKIEDKKLDYMNLSTKETYKLSMKHALMMIEKEGGKVGDNEAEIKFQKPVPVKFEQGFEGEYPVDRISFIKVLNQKTPETSFDFTGNGFVMRGNVSFDNKKPTKDYAMIAELYIDGKLTDSFSFLKNGKCRKNDMFWKYQLPEAKHHVVIKQVYFDNNLEFKTWDIVTYSANKQV